MYVVRTWARLRGGRAQVAECGVRARRADTGDLDSKLTCHVVAGLASAFCCTHAPPRCAWQHAAGLAVKRDRTCARLACRGGRPPGPKIGGLERPPWAQGLPREAVPEHLDRTSTVAGSSVVCIWAVQTGAVIGQHRVGGVSTAEVCTRRPAGWRKRGPCTDRARLLRQTHGHPPPNQHGCGPPVHQ